MSIPYKRWREANVYFLDDGFDADDAHDCLQQAGFSLQRFRTYFPGERDGSREQSVEDPRVIQLCNKHGWLLVTLDSEMINRHRREIVKSSKLGILATAHNTVDNVMECAESLVMLKDRMEKNNFKKRGRPWYAQFNRSGQFTRGSQPVEE